MVRVPDLEWEKAVEMTRSGLGPRTSARITDYHGYWDIVIEVWDLARTASVAKRRFADFFLGFLESGEVIAFQISETYGARIDVGRICVQMDKNSK